MDCGSLVPTLIESELFGYVKGAFTGANRSKTGLLAAAEGGTVFLDEIGELPLDLQAKLLRALQEKEVRPVGATHAVPISARILAATNRDLAGMVESGRFRKDLSSASTSSIAHPAAARAPRPTSRCWPPTSSNACAAKTASPTPSPTTRCA